MLLAMTLVAAGAIYFLGRASAQQSLSADDINPGQMFSLTNSERRAAGAPNLKLADSLNKSASDKCADMAARNYWSHNTPEGTEPWALIASQMSFAAAGENLGRGFTSADQVIKAWMSSQNHRYYLLKQDFTHVGFGVCYSDNFQGLGPQLIVVQHLVRSQAAPQPAAEPVEVSPVRLPASLATNDQACSENSRSYATALLGAPTAKLNQPDARAVRAEYLNRVYAVYAKRFDELACSGKRLTQPSANDSATTS